MQMIEYIRIMICLPYKYVILILHCYGVNFVNAAFFRMENVINVKLARPCFKMKLVDHCIDIVNFD